ncbi:hypothetical protein ACA910_001113 [Epithemia clementina (nom. ined.)]
MGLVCTWLTGIGLSYAWPTFEAAGIVTPAALAHLDVTVFAALGVTDPEDRRKLFYLVQRIKLAVVNDQNNINNHGNGDASADIDTVATTVDQVVAQTLQQRTTASTVNTREKSSQPSYSLSTSNYNQQKNRQSESLPEFVSSEEEEEEVDYDDEMDDNKNNNHNGHHRRMQQEEETPVQEARRVLASKVVLPQQQQSSSSSRRSIRALNSPQKSSSSRSFSSSSSLTQPPHHQQPSRSISAGTTGASIDARKNSSSAPNDVALPLNAKVRSTTSATSSNARTTTSRMVPPASSTITSTAGSKSRTSLPQPTKSRMPAKTNSRLTALQQRRHEHPPEMHDEEPLHKEEEQRRGGNEQIRALPLQVECHDDEDDEHDDDDVESDDKEQGIHSDYEGEEDEDAELDRNNDEDGDYRSSDQHKVYENPQPFRHSYNGATSASSEESIASRTRSARTRLQQQQQQKREGETRASRSGLTPPRQRRLPSETNLQKPSNNTSGGTTQIATRTTTTTSSTATTRSNQPKSNRTGKSLSAIPSDRILPMSPLMGFVSEKDNSSNKASATTTDQIGENEKEPPRSRSNGRRNHINAERRLSNGSQNSSNSQSRRRRRQASFDVASNNNIINNHEQSSDSERSESSVGSFKRRTKVVVDKGYGGQTTPQPQQHASRLKNESRRKTVAVVTTQYRAQQQRTTTTTRETASSDYPPLNSFKAQIEDLRDDNDEEHEELLKTLPPADEIEEDDMRIRVVIRKRPMSKNELVAANSVDVIHPLDYQTHGRILVYQPKTRVDLTKEIETVPFSFDNVFDESSTNTQIYERTVRNLIPPLFEGQWGCVFAYGQTGSGKTFTMMGSNMTTSHTKDSSMYNNLGLYYMAALDIFQALNTPGFEHFSVCVSLFEIYGGKLFDLLNERNQIKCLEDHQGKVRFPGLSEHALNSADSLIAMIEEGSCNRSTGSTSRNADSSRSHAVLQLHVYQPTATTSRRRANSRKSEFSRLTFIDLAGSERGADTYTSSKETRMEGAEINTSLLALKEVIRALATGHSMAHVPFRGSKLTQVLKESFVGESCRSVMIACVSPNIGDCEQTLNTLRYANRVKERNPHTGELSVLLQVSSQQRRQQQQHQAPSPTNYGSRGRIGSSSSFSKNAAPEKPPEEEEDEQEAPPEVEEEPAIDEDEEDEFDDIFGSPTEIQSPSQGQMTLERDRSVSPHKSGLRNAPSADMESATSCNSHTLDEILGEPDAAAQAAQQVILAHKETMTTMLEMVNDEMSLANQTGPTTEEFIVALNEIHAKQLDMFAMVRDRILEYRALRNHNNRSHTNGTILPVHGDVSEDEGSIEDLRED